MKNIFALIAMLSICMYASAQHEHTEIKGKVLFSSGAETAPLAGAFIHWQGQSEPESLLTQ